MYALLTERGAPGQIYAGLSNGEIWHSSDYGERWRQLAVQLPAVHSMLLMR